MNKSEFTKIFKERHPFIADILEENGMHIASDKKTDSYMLRVEVTDPKTENVISVQDFALSKQSEDTLDKAITDFSFTRQKNSENVALGLMELSEQKGVIEDTVFVTLTPIDYLYLKKINKEHQDKFTNVLLLPPNLAINSTDNDGWNIFNNQVFERVKKIVLMLPNLEYSELVKKNIKQRTDVDIFWFNYPKALKELSNKECVEQIVSISDFIRLNENNALVSGINSSLSDPISGIWQLQDVEDEVDLAGTLGLQPGYESGYPSLDKKFTVYLGDFTIVTGIPGHGKSTLINNIAHNLCRKNGWSMAVFSPESKPISRFFVKMQEMYHCEKITSQTKEQKDISKEWINQNVKMLLPARNDFNAWTFQGILELVKTAIKRYGCKIIVLDPWNHINHEGKDMDQGYISQCTTLISNFCEENNVHVFLTVHPNKMQRRSNGFGAGELYDVPSIYDMAGSAMFANKPGNILSVYRFPQFTKQNPLSNVIMVQIQKLKRDEAGDLGKAFLYYASETGALSDRVNEKEFLNIIEENYEKLVRGDLSNSQLTNLVKKCIAPRTRQEDLRALSPTNTSNARVSEHIEDSQFDF